MSAQRERKNRFNSFELLTDDESNSNLSQTSLKNTILELQQFFPEKPLDVQEVNDLIDESINEIEAESNDDEFKAIKIYNLKFMKKIRHEHICTELLKLIRSLIEESRASDEIINWDLIVKDGFKVECYLTFVSLLIRLFVQCWANLYVPIRWGFFC